jgi:CheY-like chemotaxis protein
MKPETNPINLLVADDNTVNRFRLGLYVKSLGYVATMVETGVEALDMARKERFDVILLDLNMPEMEGDEVLRHLKNDPQLRDIPVIIVSGVEDMNRVSRCLKSGANDFLPKPFDVVLLKEKIERSLALRSEPAFIPKPEIKTPDDYDQLIAACNAIINGRFDLVDLSNLMTRNDKLGQFARVFQQMNYHLQRRESTFLTQLNMDRTR